MFVFTASTVKTNSPLYKPIKPDFPSVRNLYCLPTYRIVKIRLKI